MERARPIRNGANVYVAPLRSNEQAIQADPESVRIGFLDAEGCFR